METTTEEGGEGGALAPSCTASQSSSTAPLGALAWGEPLSMAAFA